MANESVTANPDSKRKRLAIVGGGPSALVAAFHLTRNEPDAYDITIYEMSWRLGGKTVSGRGEHGRIEEHGLHILFGCYHNVFATMLDCYGEMHDRQLVSKSEHRLQHFYDAIRPHHFGVIGDDRPKPWQPISLEFPSNRGVPGDAPLPSIFDLLSTLFQLLWMALVSPRSLRFLHYALGPLFDFRNRWTANDFNRKKRQAKQKQERRDRKLGGDFLSRALLKLAKSMLDKRKLGGQALLGTARLMQKLSAPLQSVLPGLLSRWWVTADFMLALLRGLIDDEVLSQAGGFEKIDAYDLRGWLYRHGAEQETLASPWIRVIYDAAFSYPKGGLAPRSDQTQPGEAAGESVAAGAALRALMLMTLTYKGAFYNKMQAGMGDVIHVPLYLVLKNRGVKIEFFHRLTDLEPASAADGSYVIDNIELDTLPEELPSAAEYQPLVQVRDLKCWPSAPQISQLPESCHERALAAESYAKSPTPSRKRILKRGRDFDAVILGTPVACLPYVCPTLLAFDAKRSDAPKPSLRDQSKIDTVQTIAVQLWLKPTLKELGWREPSPLLSLFLDPLNTWCDMTHLGPCEDWPANLRPSSVSYFCGALPHEHEFPAPDALDQVVPLRAAIGQQVHDVTKILLDQQLFQLLPTVRSANGFNYGLLVDPHNGKDSARLQAAYLRANYEPHALCTLALPGKTPYRMKADGTGYSNLFVTGDWIDNNVLLACVEGAFQSGIRTARAVAAHYGGAVDEYVIVAEGLMNLPVVNPTAPPPSTRA
jgi:uncharacterized protein with NAD-binding domain and iron-sulfur cluster